MLVQANHIYVKTDGVQANNIYIKNPLSPSFIAA